MRVHSLTKLQRKSVKLLNQYASKLGKVGQLLSGQFGEKTKKCYKISIESNQNFNTTLATFDTFLAESALSNEDLSSYEIMKDKACTGLG